MVEDHPPSVAVVLQMLADLRREVREELNQIQHEALADGESRVLVPGVTGHIESNGWLVREFLGARTRFEGQSTTILGIGFRR